MSSCHATAIALGGSGTAQWHSPHSSPPASPRCHSHRCRPAAHDATQEEQRNGTARIRSPAIPEQESGQSLVREVIGDITQSIPLTACICSAPLTPRPHCEEGKDTHHSARNHMHTHRHRETVRCYQYYYCHANWERTCTYAPAHAHKFRHTHKGKHARAQKHTHMYTYARTSAHTHTHAHISTVTSANAHEH